MKGMLLLLGIAALSAGLSPSASSLEVPLKYEKASAGTGGYAFSGFGNGLFSSVKPAGKWVLPPFNTDKPMYAVLRLGDKPHLLVLDTKKAGHTSYSRLWVDHDGNGELQNEKPVDFRGLNDRGILSLFSGGKVAEFTSLDLMITIDGAQVPYCIQLNVRNRVGSAYSQGTSFFYQVACTYTGTFQAGGKQYTVTLSDRNGNGRFDDPAEIPESGSLPGLRPVYPKGDFIFLAGGRKADVSDGTPLGDLLLLNDTLYLLKVDLARGRMTLDAVKGGLSPLKLPVRPERLSLISEDGKHGLMIFQPAGEVVRVPAGRYRLLAYQLLRRDDQGDLWRFQASGTVESPPFEVVKGAGAAPVFGEPFTPNIEVQARAYTPVGSNYLSFMVFGQGREIMTGLSHLDGTSTRIPLSRVQQGFPREPAYTIVKPDGEIVAKGSFEYG